MKTKIKRESKKVVMPVKLIIIIIVMIGVLGIPKIAMQVYAQNNHINLIQSRGSMAVLAEQEIRDKVQKADKKNVEDNIVEFQTVSERTNSDKPFTIPAKKDAVENKDCFQEKSDC